MKSSKANPCHGEAEDHHQSYLQLVGERSLSTSSSSPSTLISLGEEPSDKEKKATTGGLDHMRLPFAYKLHLLLCDVEKSGWDQIISWVEDGNAFKIHDRRKFEVVIQPHYFKQSKMASFIRQCYMYGFSKIESGPGLGSYFHPSFQRCDQAKSLTIQRHNPTRKHDNYHRNASCATTIVANAACIGQEKHQEAEARKHQPIKNTTRFDIKMDNNSAPFINDETSGKGASAAMAALCRNPCMIDLQRSYGTISSSARFVDFNIDIFLKTSPPRLCSGPGHQEEVGQEADNHHKLFVGHEVSSFEPRPIELMVQESGSWDDSCTNMPR